MPRKLSEIIAHIRAVASNPSVSTTLIQTEDLLLLCDQAEGPRIADDVCGAIKKLRAGAQPQDVIDMLEDAIGI